MGRLLKVLLVSSQRRLGGNADNLSMTPSGVPGRAQEYPSERIGLQKALDHSFISAEVVHQ